MHIRRGELYKFEEELKNKIRIINNIKKIEFSTMLLTNELAPLSQSCTSTRPPVALEVVYCGTPNPHNVLDYATIISTHSSVEIGAL